MRRTPEQWRKEFCLAVYKLKGLIHEADDRHIDLTSTSFEELEGVLGSLENVAMDLPREYRDWALAELTILRFFG